MRKLSEYKNEDAIELLADLMIPAVDILASPEVKNAFSGGKQPLEIVQVILKHKPKACMDLLRILDGSDDFECNIITAPKMLLELLNDKELMSFFAEQGKMIGGVAFGSDTANTEETEAI